MKKDFGYIITAAASLLLLSAVALNAQEETLSRNFGLRSHQLQSELPVSKASPVQAVPVPKAAPETRLADAGCRRVELLGGWEMASDSLVTASAKSVFDRTLDTREWYSATVPGTVLGTLVDSGVYPDPYYGLNNLTVPDWLCHRQWWYRIAFPRPDFGSERTELRFEGINYRAEVWLNGVMLGRIDGAFSRGIFDVTDRLGDDNVLAVKICPPQNPGIPYEPSMRATRSVNGGQLCLDGPTFISSEGWDWVRGVRDRNIGIWQGVYLEGCGNVKLENPFVITDLPLPRTDEAFLMVKAHLKNLTDSPRTVTLKAEMDGRELFSREVTVAASSVAESIVSAADCEALHLKNPRLWWPNGYGEQNLYTMKLSVIEGGKVTGEQDVRFGVRELTYELTVDSAEEEGMRIEFQPVNDIRNGDMPFDSFHRRTVTGRVVVPAFKDGVDVSAYKRLPEDGMSPYLVIRCNGRRIFLRGGNWGMDDMMKRVSRERLEPAVRLHKEQHFNMIRNWTGEQTEKDFYDLCDEYGMLVWNDFWISTEKYNQNPLDEELFMANVRETLLRFRNHPSIAVWCPRNEGYANFTMEPLLQKATASLDGTRFYSPTSWYMNISANGPYFAVSEEKYMKRAVGFSTEIGTVAYPTAESMRKFIPEEDLWPIGDVWFYHDAGFGHDRHIPMMAERYGESNGVEDFCRKAQLFSYYYYRLFFETWSSRLWQTNSGILLWMSHPAWPSVQFQTYSWDFETLGAFYGSRKACEDIHIMKACTDGRIMVVNYTREPLNGASVRLSRLGLDGRPVEKPLVKRLDIAPEAVTQVTELDLAPDSRCTLLRLELLSGGRTVSVNDYFIPGEKSLRDLNDLPEGGLAASKVSVKSEGGKHCVTFRLRNTSDSVLVAVKLNARDSATGEAILPAYISDGYFNLLPGESRTLTAEFSHDGRWNISAEAYNMNRKTIIR